MKWPRGQEVLIAPNRVNRARTPAESGQADLFGRRLCSTTSRVTRRRLGTDKRLLIVFVLTGILLSVTPAAATQLNRDTGHFRVPGLRQPVQLVMDRWGVPHIYAQSVADVFLAQGFNAARERLFQIDLWRRRGLGQLSPVLGPSYVEQDRAARLFLYRGDMRREWDSYGPGAELAATRFTQGINAYVDWLGRHPEAMPEEFRILGYTPDHWQAADIVRIRSHGLTRNLTSEVARSKVTCVAGAAADRQRVALMPKRDIVVPVGFDPCALPDDVLRVFQLATQDVKFANGQIRTLPTQPDEALEASNNWVVAPQRTATGRPILANDPHRVYSAPSLRYISHLVAPGMNVVGANEPFLPGVSIGHNENIAFGLTIFPLDQEDLYVYQLDPADHSRYRYGDGWERIRTSTEKIAVAGAPARQVELAYTRHGPVIAVDESRHLAYAVRTAWLQPGMSPYYGSQKYMTARNFTEFTDAMRDWGAPTENQVYADVRGNIGWVPGGMAPIRRGYDGLMPVPGDGRYEWNGFYNGDILPRSYNPTEGFIATANQFNLPPGYPYPLGFEWTNPARYTRIADVLSKTTHESVADSMRLQGDQVSLVAQRTVALLAGLSSSDPDTAAALRLLIGWDGNESVDSAAAALFEVWRKRHLGPAYVKSVVPPKAVPLIGQPDPVTMLDTLEHPSDIAARNALLLNTLGEAYKDVSKLLGLDSTTWQWGRLQRTTFAHPLAPAVDEQTRARLNVGPFPRGGSEYTVNASSYNANFEQTAGPSFRMVLDVGNWDASRTVNTPGQSGRPGDPHYRDLAGKWSRTEYFPLLYSRTAVERNAERHIMLFPAN